jgi:steroid delta-isomerase-like uncharacterized protein
MHEPCDYPRLAEEAFNRRDLAALAGLWSPDFHYQAPGDETHGRDAALEREHALFEAFPDLRADLGRSFTAGDRLVIEGVLAGTHGGPLRLGGLTVPATGRPIAVRFVGVFEYEAGLVRRERVYYDRLALLQQLGIAQQEVVP